MSRPERAAVVRAFRADVHAELDAVLAVAAAAYDEATHTESKAENRYDTRSLEASYLAAGQAVRVASLRHLAAWFDALEDTTVASDDGAVGPGALVALRDADAVRWCFVAPDGGGRVVLVGGVRVRLVTPSSPLGAALVGARAGDEVEVEEPRRGTLEVVDVVGPGRATAR